MARVKGGPRAHARHTKVLKGAKGHYGRRNSCFRTAIQSVEKAGQYAYRDRRVRKREFRSLWIVRINAAARLHGLSYSQLMHGLKCGGVGIDRKILAEAAYRDPVQFSANRHSAHVQFASVVSRTMGNEKPESSAEQRQS